MNPMLLRELLAAQEKIWLALVNQSRQVGLYPENQIHFLKAEHLSHQALLELEALQNKVLSSVSCAGGAKD